MNITNVDETRSMTPEQKRLFELYQQRAVMKEAVTLASGKSSDIYFDGRMVQVFPESAYLIGEVIYERIKDLEIDAIGGIAVGAVPLITSAVISCHHHGKPIEGFWVREKKKDHGTQKQVEGNLAEGARVVIVDDVVTSGGSILKAVEAAVEFKNVDVVLVLSLIDRQEGGAERIRDLGHPFDAIYTKADFA